MQAERRPVRVVPMLGLSLLLFLGGWTALWVFARYEAVATFARWRANERSFGRAWTCPDEHVGGFPLGIVLSCDHPTFKGPVADGLFQGELGGLKADARLYFPTNVAVTLAGPLRMQEVGGPRQLDAAWTSGLLTLRGSLPGDLDRGQLDMTGLSVGAGQGATPPLGQADRLTLGFKPVERSADVRMDLETTVAAEGARIPTLDAAFASSDPLSLRFSGFLTQLGFTGGITLPEVLDPWVAAGGQLHVQSLIVTKGAFQVDAAGRLGLDEEHRPQGRLDAGFSGLAPVAARFGIPLGALQVGGLLSGLLGGAAASSDAPPADLRLPVIAKDGRLKLGQVDTGVRLLPLY
ncbi:DUF2125 domain-containing protein [Lichenihabitans sp. Uapishka_5]|uniref:DUF2125 domain-containing protein n=1 Tax=Lichenihabitans sp. Uapishka_5 TaxID=3037302 RepID=UPI0029E7FF14|nr:DUF2125 domain-containing protein [Lichenihabitans sp. Uapishka_5]MDX7952956.1 DUF2125 domain-containing protein [Lichenihabitans sp. Uapishka_5]